MKFGILGLGSIGCRHAENLKALGHTVIGYDTVMRQRFALGGVLWSREEVIADADALVIASPTQQHYRDLLDCTATDKPVFVEKPIAATTAQLEHLQDALIGKTVMVGTNLRFHPCVQQAKQWITDGHIGRPLWSSWTCAALSAKAPYLSDGVILNTGAHEVDAAMHLLGPVNCVLSANAKCVRPGTANSDINTIGYHDAVVDFVLEHESGLRSSFHLDFITPNEIRECWIVGDKNIGIDFLGRRNSLGAMSTGHAGSYDTDYVDEMKAFVSRIEGEAVPGATGEDGLATLKVLLDVRKKAALQ